MNNGLCIIIYGLYTNHVRVLWFYKYMFIVINVAN